MNTIKFEDYPEFKPDYTPVEMASLGIFGGAYFNLEKEKKFSINSYWDKSIKETNFLKDCAYEKKHKSFKFSEKLLNKENPNINLYKVNCGSTYEQWVEKNWIFDIDPYGWYNWYINFYYGRRHECDKIQIKRWKQFKARHLGMLKSRGEKYKLETNNLKTKQNLLHWAINWELH